MQITLVGFGIQLLSLHIKKSTLAVPEAAAASAFAARTASKPGLGQSTTTTARADSRAATTTTVECWTVVSSPSFAVSEIRAEPMQDAVTGAFKPQVGYAVRA